MIKLALTFAGSHCIYEITIGYTVPPRIIFERKIFGPGSVEYISKDVIFYNWTSGARDIFKTKTNNTNADNDSPIYHHPTWIRDIKIRDSAPRYKFFFTAYHSKYEVRFFFLDEMDNAVPYYTLAGSELKFSDPCHTGEETYWKSWSGKFTFDDKDNLYVSTGWKKPSGIYKISGAGFEAVTGNVQRIYESMNSTTCALEFIKPNSLLYTSGTKIYKLDLGTLESTLQYDVSDFTDKDITSISLIND